jgi:hypothetical protein
LDWKLVESNLMSFSIQGSETGRTALASEGGMKLSYRKSHSCLVESRAFATR